MDNDFCRFDSRRLYPDSLGRELAIAGVAVRQHDRRNRIDLSCLQNDLNKNLKKFNFGLIRYNNVKGRINSKNL